MSIQITDDVRAFVFIRIKQFHKNRDVDEAKEINKYKKV